MRRAHLLQTLGAILTERGPRMALLSAPAGFGKTTLATLFSEEAAAEGAAIAWAGLDSSGNGPRVMWRAVLSALTTSSAEAAEALTGLLRSQRRPDDRFFQRLHDALAELPAPTILVLDDVQAVDDPDAAGQLGILLNRLPESVRAVLSSRHDPSFSLHEWRLAGHLIELRAEALAFTPAETEQVLSGEGLDDTDVAAVMDLTEGWPAGVQLARGVLRKPGDGARLAALFNAQSGVLADYLFHETFTSQLPAAQDLLMRTSVVSAMSDSLAAELSGRTDAGEVINQMADLAPLLSRYDAADGVGVLYCYHPLLRAYLVGELARRDRRLLRATNRQAALWYEQHDEYLKAIIHARASEDSELLDLFLQRYAAGLIIVGESGSLLHVLSKFHLAPTDWEAAIGAAAAVRCRDTTTAAQWLGHPHVVSDPSDVRLAQLRASVAFKISGLNGSPDRLGRSDVEREGSHRDDDLELLIVMNRITALTGVTNDGFLERDLKNALALAVSLGRTAAELQCQTLWAAASLGQGDFVEAGVRVSAALARNEELVAPEDGASGLLNVIAAWVAYEGLDDVSAERGLRGALAEFGRAMDPSTELAVHQFADLLGGALHPEPVGFAAVEPRALHAIPSSLPPSLQAIAYFMLVRSALGTGRPDRLRQAIDHAASMLGPCGDVVTMQSMVLTAQRRGDEASKLLQPVLDERARCRSATSLVEALTMATTHALQANHPYEAFTLLQRAMSTARANGAYRALVEAPSDVHLLMSEQADRLSEHREVVDRVLAYVHDSIDDSPDISPLTPRELDIIRELPTLNRVDEIAGDLLVSTNTVKTHIRGIYRKLGVSSRKDAVAVARRRGIL